MKPRPDLLTADSPQDLEVFQLTADPDTPSSHIYMEAQIFAPDSKRFVLHTSAHAHGSDPSDPSHRYLLCDTESGKLAPITDEIGASGPAVSPDGGHFYYFVTDPRHDRRILLRRRNLDGTSPETLSVLDGPLPGTPFRPSRINPLSTLSSDGARLATSCFLGDGIHPQAPWGLLVFDLQSGHCHLPLHGPSWCNMHPQYSRSLDAERSHDIMVQENHGNLCRPDGSFERLTGLTGGAADIHVIRDDGQHFRNLPWGRDEDEYCSGHQCWRGRSGWAIAAASVISQKKRQLIEGCPMPHEEHNGRLAPGARRNELSRDFPNANFNHFATDLAGDRLITDYRNESLDALYLMRLGEPGKGAFKNTRFLLRPNASGKKTAHIHPFLSPDGNTAFFNSDESGQLQAYMIRNLPRE